MASALAGLARAGALSLRRPLKGTAMVARSSASSLLVLGCGVLAACGTAPPRAREAVAQHLGKVAERPRCPRPAPEAQRLSPVGRQGSAVALARAGHELLAYVADRQAKRLDVVDVSARALLGTIALAGAPEEVVVLPDGRLVVSLGDRAALEAIAVGTDSPAAQAEKSCLLEVPRGPSGLALSEDGKKLVATSTQGESLSLFDAGTLASERSVAVGRSPRGVVVEGQRAFISHLAGDAVSVVDLDKEAEARKVGLGLLPAAQRARPEVLATRRRSAQAYSLVSVELPPLGGGGGGRRGIVVPAVSVDPGDQHGSIIYYGPPPTEGIPKETPVALRLDVEAERRLPTHVLSLALGGFVKECLLPRASAFRASTTRLYVACRGIDELLELDARSTDPMRNVLRRFDISKGVTGVAVGDAEGVSVSFGEFDSKLDVVHLADGTRQTIDLSAGQPALSASFRMGRELFYRTGDSVIAFDGVGCASCHPDGGDDGLTWSDSGRTSPDSHAGWQGPRDRSLWMVAGHRDLAPIHREHHLAPRRNWNG